MKVSKFRILFFILPVLGFAQIFERKTELSGFSGMQVSEIYASGKGGRLNEAYYFNPLLYYRTRYLIQDDEVLGVLRGRLTKEEPLSSFTLSQLNEIRNPQSEYSNLLRSYPQYQSAVSNYDLFIRIFEDSLRRASETERAIQEGTEEYFYEEEYLLDETIAPAAEPAELQAPAAEPPAPQEAEGVLSYRSPRALLQEIAVATNVITNIYQKPLQNEGPFPTLEEALKDSAKSLTEKELEFIIRYEQLARAYSNTVLEYKKLLEARNLVERSLFFDPADSKESFRVFVFGEENPESVWSRSFTLDGVKNYQSYDQTVWYLGYEIPLTKKDLRLLANIYRGNKKVSFRVVGQGGEVSFTLSGQLAAAIKQLLDDYALGKMVVPELDSDVSPLLR